MGRSPLSIGIKPKDQELAELGRRWLLRRGGPNSRQKKNQDFRSETAHGILLPGCFSLTCDLHRLRSREGRSAGPEFVRGMKVFVSLLDGFIVSAATLD
jgi:hypothetical protein